MGNRSRSYRRLVAFYSDGLGVAAAVATGLAVARIAAEATARSAAYSHQKQAHDVGWLHLRLRRRQYLPSQR